MIHEKKMLKGFGGGFGAATSSGITITILNRKR